MCEREREREKKICEKESDRIFYKPVLFLMGFSPHLFYLFNFFWTVEMSIIKHCRWLDSNREPLALKVTTLSHNRCTIHSKIAVTNNQRSLHFLVTYRYNLKLPINVTLYIPTLHGHLKFPVENTKTQICYQNAQPKTHP